MLSEEERERRREALNFYTCALEHKLDIDNRWGRGHADYLECSKSFFGSFVGNLDTFNRFKMDVKKQSNNNYHTSSTHHNNPSDNNYNVYKKAGLCVAGASAFLGATYGIYLGAKKLYNHVVSKVKK